MTKRMESGGGSDRGVADEILARAAMLYYREGLTQSDVAKRMNISRATVLSYLQQARETGIVEIRIAGEHFAKSGLSRSISARFGLVDTYIAFADETHADEAALAQRTVEVAAAAMLDLLRPGETLGVSWGRTMLALATALPMRTIRNLVVVQLIGAMRLSYRFGSEACAIEIARRLGAECRTLNAPAIVTSSDLARRLREEPIVASQIALFDMLDSVVFSVGDVEDDTTIVEAGAVSHSEIRELRKLGAKGVICGRFIDAQGSELIAGDLSERMICVDLPKLKRAGRRILVAHGTSKLDAVLAALRAGYVTHLVLDEETAKRLNE